MMDRKGGPKGSVKLKVKIKNSEGEGETVGEP